MKMKRVLLVSVAIIFLTLGIYEVYLFNKFDSNLIVHISNYTYSEDDTKPLHYEVFINGEVYKKGEVGCCGFDAHMVIPVKGVDREKSLRVRFNDEVQNEITVDNSLVKFLVFEVYNSEEMNNSELRVVTHQRFSPITLE